MPVTTKRGITRLTSLQICDRFMGKQTAQVEFLDMQQFTLGATSALANTTTNATVAIKNCALGDMFVVYPAALMPAGLSVAYAIVTTASSGSPSPENPAGETAGVLTVVFDNGTAGALAAGGTYNYLQVSKTAGAI